MPTYLPEDLFRPINQSKPNLFGQSLIQEIARECITNDIFIFQITGTNNIEEYFR